MDETEKNLLSIRSIGGGGEGDRCLKSDRNKKARGFATRRRVEENRNTRRGEVLSNEEEEEERGRIGENRF